MAELIQIFIKTQDGNIIKHEDAKWVCVLVSSCFKMFIKRMKQLKFIISIIYYLLFAIASFAQKKAIASKPNIIVICADDLGWKETSAFGNTRIKTPHIDSLGIRGTRFTQAYTVPRYAVPAVQDY